MAIRLLRGGYCNRDFMNMLADMMDANSRTEINILFRGAAHRKKTPHGGRDLQLALAVSEALDRHDLARAIGTVADREGLTDNRVEKAWRAYRDVLSCEADMIDGKK